MKVLERLRGHGAGEAAPDFLAPLSRDEKIAVGNFNSVVYEAVIAEKKGGASIEIVSEHPEEIALLRRLSVDDLERLSESVRYVMRADDAPTMADAARLYREAAEINPYNDLALMSCGVAIAQTGKLREGIKWVEKAVAVNPASERARGNLEAMRRDL